VGLRVGGWGSRSLGRISQNEVHVFHEFARHRLQGDLLELAVLRRPLIEHGKMGSCMEACQGRHAEGDANAGAPAARCTQ